MYTLENNSFENKRMRVQYKQLENKLQRTYKEVGGGKSYEKEHKVIKWQTKTIAVLLIKCKGCIFEKDVKIGKPMVKLIIEKGHA